MAFSQESDLETPETAENASEPESTGAQETAQEEQTTEVQEEEPEETEKPETPAPKITVADIDPSTEYLAKSGTSVNASAWSHIGEYFAVSWNNTTILFESETNNIAAIYSNTADNTINPFTDITKITFAPDDETLLSVHNNNTAMVHSIGDSGSALITGTGDMIADAVYTGTSFRLIIPLDEQNLYDCTRQPGTGSFDLEKRLEFDKRIIALASNEAGGKIFVTFEDGSVNLIDTRTWQILGDMTAYTESEIYPAFAPDGIHFLDAQDGYTIFVSSTEDTTERHTIEEPDGFVYDAVFMPDGKSIVAATQSGYVRIYDIETGYVLYEFQLVDLDAAKTLSVSPDGEFVLVGTAMGYIYRWSLHGYEFDQERKKYVDEEGKVYGQNFDRLENSIIFTADAASMPLSYYNAMLGLSVDYRNYTDFLAAPFYWGVNGGIGISFPNKHFPYNYESSDGEKINEPSSYLAYNSACAGFVYVNKKYGYALFSEVEAGLNVKVLYNNSFKNAHAGKPYPGVFAGLSAGASWKYLRASVGAVYDLNYELQVRANVGAQIPTRVFKKLFSKNKEKTTVEKTEQE